MRKCDVSGCEKVSVASVDYTVKIADDRYKIDLDFPNERHLDVCEKHIWWLDYIFKPSQELADAMEHLEHKYKGKIDWSLK